MAIACGSSSSSEDAFTPPSDGIQIGTTGVYLRTGETVTEMPKATTAATAPKITSVTARKTATHTFEVDIAVENEPGESVGIAYLDFGSSGIYRAKLTPYADTSTSSGGGGDSGYAAQCKQLMEQQGKTCTDACISACACVSCGDATVENNLKLGCAATCSANVDSGAIKSAPYNGSEKKLADVAYNGDPESGLMGTASQAKCDAAKCTTAAGGAGGGSNKSRTTTTWALVFETPTVPVLTPMFAPAVQTDDRVETSEVAAAGQVSICDKHEGCH